MNIITAEQAAKELNLSKNKLYAIMRTDISFPAVRAGKKWLIIGDKLELWINTKLLEKQ